MQMLSVAAFIAWFVTGFVWGLVVAVVFLKRKMVKDREVVLLNLTIHGVDLAKTEQLMTIKAE